MVHGLTGRGRAAVALTIAALLLVAGACSSSSSDSTPTTAGGGSGTTAPSGSGGTTPGSAPSGTTPGTTAARPLRILVTDDDGVGAPGIDALVEGLQTLPDVEVTVVAPAENQSGTGGKTTDGPLTVTDATTASGYEAKAVAGFPADTIVWAIDQGGIDFVPDLVISGINVGQNIGPAVELSGTVGAARAAGSRGIPALAASQGIASEPDWPSGVELVLAWVTENRADLLAGTDAKPAPVDNLNIPTCTAGELHDQVEVPVATDLAGRDWTVSDCTAAVTTTPTDDVGAFIVGYPTLSDITPAA